MLSDREILQAIGKGNINIESFNLASLGTNSYDCRLGEYFYRQTDNNEIAFLDTFTDNAKYWKLERSFAFILIRPGEFILAHTEEFITCKNGIVGKLYSRSTVARSGLSVCRCAGLGDVGYSGRWTLEIVNHSNHPIALPVGFKICQIAFEEVGTCLQRYPGKYGKMADWTPEDMLPK